MRLTSGSEIGRFVIGDRIGAGSASEVFQAQERDGGKRIALKLLARARLFNAWARATFRQEVETITRLAQPGIVPIYQFGQQREQVYLTMPYMVGGNLTTKLKDGALELVEVRRIATTLAVALDSAHSSGLMHGNLKPTNVLFDKQQEPALSDFGASQQRGANSGLLRGNAHLQTLYLSPEQIEQDRVNAKSDIYSFAALLYHMLIGQPPYSGSSSYEIVQAHLKAPIPRIGNELDVLFSSGLAKCSAERPASANELVALIPDQLSEKPRRRWWHFLSNETTQ